MLLVCGSIAQAAYKSEEVSGFVSIVDLDQFMTRMGLSQSEWTERHAMVPCVSVTVEPTKADAFEEQLRRILCGGRFMALDKREVAPLSYDRSGPSGESFHLFVYIEQYAGESGAEFAGEPVSFEWLGWGFHEHQDNIDCTARHTPDGFLLVYDPLIRRVEGSHRAPISTLDIASTLLGYFGVCVPDYMHSPDPAIIDLATPGTAVVVNAGGGGVEIPVTREAVRQGDH